jgi:hypothetical protein
MDYSFRRGNSHFSVGVHIVKSSEFELSTLPRSLRIAAPFVQFMAKTQQQLATVTELVSHPRCTVDFHDLGGRGGEEESLHQLRLRP